MNIMPNVLVKDSEGNTRMMDIYSKLANDRNIFLIGTIDEDLAGSIIMQLLHLNSDNSETPICLYINSNGGEAKSSFGIIDVIRSLRAPVYTYCIGSCASAAALIFSSGEKGNRYLYPHSRIMIHAIQGTMNGPMSNVAANYQLMESLNNDVCKIISENTGKSIEVVQEDTLKDYWMTSDIAIKYGLADKIIQAR